MAKFAECKSLEDEELRRYVSENYHKVRKCDMYEMEYEECKSLKGRFQQYFIYGEPVDCSFWKEDFDNCVKLEKSQDLNYEAMASIIHHENERLEKRMNAHNSNDVWEKRKEPPSNWSSKLPEWLEKRQENSFKVQPEAGSQTCIIS